MFQVSELVHATVNQRVIDKMPSQQFRVQDTRTAALLIQRGSTKPCDQIIKFLAR